MTVLDLTTFRSRKLEAVRLGEDIATQLGDIAQGAGIATARAAFAVSFQFRNVDTELYYSINRFFNRRLRREIRRALRPLVEKLGSATCKSTEDLATDIYGQELGRLVYGDRRTGGAA